MSCNAAHLAQLKGLHPQEQPRCHSSTRPAAHDKARPWWCGRAAQPRGGPYTHLQQVDIVGAQALQGLVQRLLDVVGIHARQLAAVPQPVLAAIPAGGTG